MSEQLGHLTADDLGSEIEFTDGGATYRGTLTKVEHGLSLSGARRSLVILEAGSWRHVKTYAAETPYTPPTAPLTPFQPPADHGDDSGTDQGTPSTGRDGLLSPS